MKSLQQRVSDYQKAQIVVLVALTIVGAIWTPDVKMFLKLQITLSLALVALTRIVQLWIEARLGVGKPLQVVQVLVFKLVCLYFFAITLESLNQASLPVVLIPLISFSFAPILAGYWAIQKKKSIQEN